jgi:anti-anti-sigma factor
MTAVEPIDLDSLHPAAVTFHLSGDVDLATADGITAMASYAIAQAAPALVLDLAEVTFMDSQGVRTLVLAHRALAQAGAELVLTGVPQRVESLLEITGLRSTFGRA